MKNKIHGWLIYLAITLVLFGIMISLQAQTQTRLASDLTLQSTSDLTIMVKNLSDKRRLLTREIQDAEASLAAYRQDNADDTAVLSHANAELNRLYILTGQAPVHGQGVRILVAKDNLLYSDLVGIVNELWSAGAEAVAINNIRITASTSIGYVEALNQVYMTCNGELLEAPYQVTAIGNAVILEKGLTMPGGIMDNLAFFKIFPDIIMEDEIEIPALTQVKNMRYGKIPPPAQESSVPKESATKNP